MFRIFRYLLCLLLLLTVKTSLRAQQYAITASTQIIPPYSVYLPDYAVPGSDKLRVILVQNDLTKPAYDVRLQLTVERNGQVIMRSAQTFNPRPISLSPGVPTVIGGTDLFDYLQSNNLEFSNGFSRDEYERTKALPEGAYRISFTAFDYRRPKVQVSNAGANIFFFQKNDPPLLNQPVCGSRVEKRDPQFLTFNWSTRNTPSPFGDATEYIFSLYEIKPKGSNPDYIIRSARPIYTVTTQTNTIVYGPGEPQLTDSMDYAWVVQARDKGGRDMYNNQGFSRSCTFSYLGSDPFKANNITKPTLKGTVTGQRTIHWSWPLAPGNAAYQVETYRLQYRATKKGDVEFDWITSEKPQDTALDINSLEPNRAYEARLQWRIAGVYGPYSDLVTVTTDSLKTFVCGVPGDLTAPANTKPLIAAVPGLIVRIGHFDILLTEVSGSDGVFTGKGRVVTPGFGIGLLMKFDRITVNTDLVVIKGEMQAVTDGIDKFVSDAVKEQRGGNDVGQTKSGDLPPDIVTKLHIFTKENIAVDTADGTITLKDSQTGEQEVVNYKDKGKTLPLTLEDVDGNMYNIDKNGKVTAAGKRNHDLAGNPAALAALNTLSLDKGMVTFAASPNSKYAFDAWKDDYAGKTVLEQSYESLGGGKYRVSAKAIVPNEQEEVIATLQQAASDIDPAKLLFVSGKGVSYPVERNGNTYTIKITGGPAGDAQEIYAAYPQSGGQYLSLGKLLVSGYGPVQKKIVLVPVGAQTAVPLEAIESSLQKAYGKIGVSYTVETDESFRDNKDWDDDNNGLLQDSRSAFLSDGFTGEEKALKKAYTRSHSVDDNTVYLFLVNEAALSDGDLEGKMPRQSQFGFVFVKNASPEAVGRTVAHETGHGAFTLEHSFSAGIGLEKGSTDNLMDYNNGYGLLKYQWDIVYDPGHVWGLLEDDQESGSVSYDDIKVFDKLKNVTPGNDKTNGTYTFIAPSGLYVTLPANATKPRFSTLDRTFSELKGKADLSNPTETLIPLGTLVSFKIGNVSYSLYNEGNTFKGFRRSDDQTKFYEDTYTAQLKPSSGIGVFMGVKGGKFISYASRYASVVQNAAISGTYTAAGPKTALLSIVDLKPASDSEALEITLKNKKAGDVAFLELDNGNFLLANDNIHFNYKIGGPVTLKAFLLDALDEKKTFADYVAYFTIATMKEDELQGLSSCMGRQFTANWRSLLATIKFVTSIITQGIRYNGSKILDDARLKTQEELLKLAQGNVEKLKELQTAIGAGADAAAINRIMVDRYSPCSLAGLTFKERKYLLDQLLKDGYNNNFWYTDPAWYTSDDGEFIVADLIQTTPPEDQPALLKEGFRANNYEWLRNLWSASRKFTNGVGYADVHGIFDVINPWIAANFSKLGVQPVQHTLSDPMFGNATYLYYPGLTPYLLGLDNNETYNISRYTTYYTGPEPVNADIEFEDAGRVYFTENYGVRNDSLMLRNADERSEPNVKVWYEEKYDPFEPVTILIAQNYAEDGFTAGKRFLVPAYMAMVYNNDIHRTEISRFVTTAGNVVTLATALLAAPETGGSSLAMITAITGKVSAVVAAADLFIQAEKNSLSPAEYAANQQYYQAWDQVKAVTAYASIAVAGANGLQWISSTVRRLKPVLDKIPVSQTALVRGVENLKDIPNSSAALIKGFGEESPMFTRASKVKYSSITEVDEIKVVAGFDDEFSKAKFFLFKGGGGPKDYVQVSADPIVNPRLPAGVAVDAAVLAKPEVVGTIDDLVKGSLLKESGEVGVMAQAAIAGATNARFNPASFTRAVAKRYTLAPAIATETAPDVIVLVQPEQAPQMIYATAAAAQRIIEKVREKDGCTRCELFSQEICHKFEKLDAKSGGAAYAVAVSKLCAQLSPNNVNSVLDYLLSTNMDNATLAEFLSDIGATGGVAHLAGNIRSIDANLVDAWKLMKAAKGDASKNYQVDFAALREIRAARTDATFNTEIGGDDGFETALTANILLNCATCAPGQDFVRTASEYVKDFRNFAVINGENKESVWNDLKHRKAINLVVGAGFQIKVLRDAARLFQGGTIRFDDSIDDRDADDPGDAPADGEPRSKCRYDIRIKGTGFASEDKHFEFKSWGQKRLKAFLASRSIRNGFAKQLHTYLHETNNIADLTYFFDGLRISKEEARSVLREVFRDNANEWFGENGTLGVIKMDQLFNTSDINDFKKEAEDLNSSIYSFVNWVEK
ncbi:hypothetical protein F0L74_09435 [Chitinophaga agrisoli]|uniref:Fibronectin type-III domain-containing protein n=1 Tax=Chitinophaga agrisoli TaxID=2607653 RepID=A0A5B2VXJ7_9BACT|nr:fibronectin type III domain-containing protein [Chitinophaga agrisoli]KAA2242739.1 hypothetical protein F0L74_09435 [Chitinophaga agrisoli]